MHCLGEGEEGERLTGEMFYVKESPPWIRLRWCASESRQPPRAGHGRLLKISSLSPPLCRMVDVVVPPLKTEIPVPRIRICWLDSHDSKSSFVLGLSLTFIWDLGTDRDSSIMNNFIVPISALFLSLSPSSFYRGCTILRSNATSHKTPKWANN